MASPNTPSRQATISQLKTPPDSHQKSVKVPKGDLTIIPRPPALRQNVKIYRHVKQSLQVRRKLRAMRELNLHLKSPPSYSVNDMDSPESESARLREVYAEKRFDKWIRKDRNVSVPADEEINVALNPFWRGEELDGPYYSWLYNNFYEQKMPVIIRLVNKFRGFPQDAETEAFEKTEEGQETLERHAPHIEKYQRDLIGHVIKQEGFKEKSPSPDYAPSPITPSPKLEMTKNHGSPRRHTRNISSSAAIRSSKARRRTRKRKADPNAAFEPDTNYDSDGETEDLPRIKRAKRNTEAQGKARDGRGRGANGGAISSSRRE